jgi:16S rRNA processing protein RimM
MAVARVLGPKGLRGGVRVEILTDWPDDLVAGASVHPEGDDEPLIIGGVESGGRVPVLYFAGRETRESIESLTGRYLEAPAHALEQGSYFWSDLIGLRVEEAGAGHIGELVEIFRTGGNEVYRVVGPAGERLIPALRTAVLEIDVAAGRMVVAADEDETVG